MDFNLTAGRIQDCPTSNMSPGHYLGPHAAPCRCREYESLLEHAGEPIGLLGLDEIGLRNRYVKALAHKKVYDSADVASLGVTGLYEVRGLDATGFVALSYLLAARGHPVPGITSLSVADWPRTSWQATWESMDGRLM